MAPTMDNTYGVLVIALVLSAILYGVTLLQTHLYWRSYPNDTRLIKFLVLLLLVTDTIHLILCTITVYTYLISDYTDPSALGRMTWSMAIQIDANVLLGLVVQCYFARRVWILGRNPYLVAAIISLSLVWFSLGLWFTVQEFVLVDVSKFGTMIWETSLGLSSAAAADILIAVSLCYYLLRSRTGFARTDSIIFKLIGYSVTTGLLTSVIALLSTLTFAVMPDNYVWLGFFWVIGKFYVNSFLATLNSRDALMEKADEPTSLHLKSLGVAEASRTKISRRPSDASRDTILKTSSWEKDIEQHQPGVSVVVETQTTRAFA